MNKKDKQKWSNIGRSSWELAREAYKEAERTGCNAADYIWEHVHDYGLNEYETGVLGEWACDNCEKLKEKDR